MDKCICAFAHVVMEILQSSSHKVVLTSSTHLTCTNIGITEVRCSAKQLAMADVEAPYGARTRPECSKIICTYAGASDDPPRSAVRLCSASVHAG